MTFEPCLDPNCKGCRWYAANQKAIQDRKKPSDAKPVKKAAVSPRDRRATT